MVEETIAQLRQSIRASIARVEGAVTKRRGERAIQRILALLWTAHDELELLEYCEQGPASRR